MSLSVYIWGIRLFVLLSSAAWLGIVFAVDPYQSGRVGVSLFFLSLFALLTGILTLGVTWFYRLALGDAGTIRYLSGAFRQALILSLCVVSCAFFQYLKILTWWDALLALATALLIEYTIRSLFPGDQSEA